MSAPQQEPAAPAQPSAPPVVGSQNLDNLQGMLNMVLIASGRFIKEHQSGGGTGRSKVNFQRAVPVATERWQDALDELENEVRLAQIVLRRDLAVLKQDRKKREVAAKEKEAEKARLAEESRSAATMEKQPEAETEKAATPAQLEAPADVEPEKEIELEKPLEREEENVPPPIDTSAAQETERDPLFDGTPTTANPQENEFDFDAMFGDAMDTTGDNNQDNMMDTSGDMDFNFDESPSMLRGLEDFAKDSVEDASAQNAGNIDVDIDMTMPDLPDLNPSTEMAAPAEQPVPAKEPTPPPADPVTNAETSNNDTSNNAEATNNDTSNDDLMGGMITDNLDDLFNMDEYANPEQSSFDDAFFDFE